ncbi:MAG: V-type ATP synthase alpha chain [Chloroflexi bacterium ADurb.Bin325]|nr:MAG: V-type ATP synthase alpha chain [Chloroflexi bacterium ADurb.Bin325]
MTHSSTPTTNEPDQPGRIRGIAGAVITVQGLIGARLYDVVHVGHERLIGEVIRLTGTRATVQVYEDTTGLRADDPVEASGAALQVELGPGLLGGVFDGVQRPLPAIRRAHGDFIARGARVAQLDRQRVWPFRPLVQPGDRVQPGDVLGEVAEVPHLMHRILVPLHLSGTIETISAGEFRLTDTIATLRVAPDGDGETAARIVPLTLMQRWPVRQPRPYLRKLDMDEPLITGQRVIDTLFPIAKGGSAIIPGGFGTGKTVTQQSLAKWSDADVIVYVGCGERGNEMTEVLQSFPQLEDPRHDGPLMNRTILIANTSNMPVAAREASIYTGITIAEYYRDMGYDVALMADSTSRWGEALREVSGRLEEIPGEEGFPAYLPARLAEFYERSGHVCCLGGDRGTAEPRRGSVTLIGAVSPPGGDFSEPITQHSLRTTGAFWALDTDLARRRHFPAIHWRNSYTLYDLTRWFRGQVHDDWELNRREASGLLQREGELLETVQLVGADALAETEQVILQVGRMLREDFLQQSAFGADAYCPPVKQFWMLKTILHHFYLLDSAVRRGVHLDRALDPALLADIARMREWPTERAEEEAYALMERADAAFLALRSND